MVGRVQLVKKRGRTGTTGSDWVGACGRIPGGAIVCDRQEGREGKGVAQTEEIKKDDEEEH